MKIIKILFLIKLLFLLSCGQETEQYNRISNKQCASLELDGEVLNHQNLSALFSCVKIEPKDEVNQVKTLKEKYPHLYKAIIKIPRKEWNSLVAPLAQIYWAENEGAEKFISNIAYLKKEGGFPQLTQIVSELFSFNFAGYIKKILENSKNKNNLTEGLYLLHTNDKVFNDSFNIFEETLYILSKGDNNLWVELNRLLSDPEGKNLFRNLLLSIINHLKALDNKKDFSKYFHYFLTTTTKKTLKPYIYNQLKKDVFTIDFYKGLIDHGFSSGKYIIPALRNLINDTSISCQKPNGDLLFANFGKKYDDLVTVLVEKDQKSYSDFLLDNKILLTLGGATCGWGRLDNYESIDLIHQFDSLATFTSDVNGYGLIKFINTISKFSGGTERTMFNIMSEDIVKAFSELSFYVIKDFPDLYNESMKTLQRMSPSLFFELGDNLKIFSNEEQAKQIASLARLINLLDNEGPELIDLVMKILAIHVDNPDKSKIFFEFYLGLVEQTRDFWTMYRSIIKTDGGAETLSNAILSIAKAFDNEKAWSDLNQVMQPSEVLTVLSSIANVGNLMKVPQGQNKELKQRQTEQILRISVEGNSEFSDSEISEILKCTKSFDPHKLYNKLRDLNDCKNVSGGLLLRVMKSLSSFNKDYIKYNSKLKSLNLLDQTGFLNEKILQEATINLVLLKNLIDSHFSSQNGLTSLLKRVGHDLFKASNKKEKGYINDLLNSFIFYEKYLGRNNEESAKAALNDFIHDYTSLDQGEIKKVVYNFSSMFSLYEKYSLPNDFKWPKNSSCRDLSKGLGEIDAPCGSSEILKNTLAKAFKVLNRKYGDRKSSLDYFIDALFPEHGIPINDGGRGELTNYILTFQDFIRFFYVGHDPKPPYVSKDKDHRSHKFIYRKENSSKEGEYTEPIISRFEVVIRDIAFKNNFLGSVWQNQVIASNDVKETVKKFSGVFKLCTNKLSYCGGKYFLKGEDKRKAKNVVDAYKSLIQLTNDIQYPGGKKFNLSPFFQAGLGALVYGSDKNAQKAKNKFGFYNYLSEEERDKHNGIFLAHLSNVSIFRNLSRFIYNRINHYYGDIVSFEKDPKVRLVIDNIIKTTSYTNVNSTIKDLMSNHQENFVDFLISISSWFSSDKVKDENIYKLEQTLFKTLFLLTDVSLKKDKPMGNILVSIFSEIVKNWDSFKKNWPNDIDYTKGTDTFYAILEFLSTEVLEKNNLETITYSLIDDVAELIKYFSAEKGDSGLIHFASRNADETLAALSGLDSYWKYLSNNKKDITSISSFLIEFTKDSKFSLKQLKQYLQSTTIMSPSNKRQHELYYLIKFLAAKEKKNKNIRFFYTLKYVFNEELGEIVEFFDRLIGSGAIFIENERQSVEQLKIQ